MHARYLIPLLLLLPLPACGDGEPDVEARNASVEEVGQQIRSAGRDSTFIRAGKWQSNVTLEQMNAPGMPAAAVERLRNVTSRQSVTSCLSKEEARRPSEDFFTGRSDQCRYEHFNMGDGKIDAKMRCSSGGTEQVMAMAGTYSPDSYDLRMTMSMSDMPGPAGGMGMTMRVQAKRIGECEAKQS